MNKSLSPSWLWLYSFFVVGGDGCCCFFAISSWPSRVSVLLAPLWVYVLALQELSGFVYLHSSPAWKMRKWFSICSTVLSYHPWGLGKCVKALLVVRVTETTFSVQGPEILNVVSKGIGVRNDVQCMDSLWRLVLPHCQPPSASEKHCWNAEIHLYPLENNHWPDISLVSAPCPTVLICSNQHSPYLLPSMI